jgi:fumarylacetoacetase
MKHPIHTTNETHQLNLESWLESANGHQDFPIQNLPFGVFKTADHNQARCGVAIGDYVIDMHTLYAEHIFKGLADTANEALTERSLNRFMAMGAEAAAAIRLSLSRSLRTGSQHQSAVSRALVPITDVTMQMPCNIGDYTDFYSSINHATSVGKLFRPENPLLPNYKWIPIAYHGRASSINLSGTQVKRPNGQVRVDSEQPPILKPTERLDYEVELGVFIGKKASPFDSVDITHAEQNFFGVCMLNDWSARDIQAWEYQPLGPFLSKNFMSSISPWIISSEALSPFRTPMQREEQDKQTMDYLFCEQNEQFGALDIQMECYLSTAQMRQDKQPAKKLSQTSFKHSFWTIAQMITHHTVNGCGLNPGDLLGSGTQSGASPDEAGSLLELTQGGQQQLTISATEKRTFLQDGDEIELRGFCQNASGLRIGLGSVTGKIISSQSSQITSNTNGHFSP